MKENGKFNNQISKKLKRYNSLNSRSDVCPIYKENILIAKLNFTQKFLVQHLDIVTLV